jgi:hypothetical protein
MDLVTQLQELDKEAGQSLLMDILNKKAIDALEEIQESKYSVSGIGSRQSQAYQEDGGANDEGYGKEPYNQSDKHSVHINGKKWKTFDSKSHATNVAKKIDGAKVVKEDLDEASEKNSKPSAYSDKNPKIDLHNKHSGAYIASTNWSPTVKHAVSGYETKYPEMKGHIRGYLSESEDKSGSVSEEFVWDDKPLNEGVRKVGELENGRHKATIHKDSETGEFVAKFHTDGKYLPDADYFGSDKEDAEGTAKHQLAQLHAKDTK